MPQSRWRLRCQAQVWRVLMNFGMFLHRLAPPRPPRISFIRTIPSTLADVPGTFDLKFYLPKDYDKAKSQDFRHVRNGKGYPVLVNYHGGGFTLGTSSDDARWIGTVVSECNAVVIGVEYRLAPEYPFPTAVDDGVDAVLWITKHSKELGLDPDKIALSGFSSGGNMCFTVPLRLYDHLTDFDRPGSRPPSIRSRSSQQPVAQDTSPTALLPKVQPETLGEGTKAVYHLQVPVEHSHKQQASTAVTSIAFESLCAIVPWYPSTDYTRTREQRRQTCSRKDQELPAIFTTLFDESYLHPPNDVPLNSPYLSPGTASDAHLRLALPDEIVLHTCEWDMLLREAEEFKDRLTSPEIGKKVTYHMIPQVPHGYDKAPNPLKPTPGVREHYLRACKELRRVFEYHDAERMNSDKPIVN